VAKGPATIGVGDRPTEVGATVRDGTLLIAADDLERTTGWTLRPEGLCRGDVCVVVRDRDALGSDDELDVAAVAAALRRPLAFEPDAAMAVLGDPADERAEQLTTLEAPPFTIPDLDGNPVSLAEYRGRKRLLLAWASW
jgi:hypothetical protein